MGLLVNGKRREKRQNILGSALLITLTQSTLHSGGTNSPEQVFDGDQGIQTTGAEAFQVKRYELEAKSAECWKQRTAEFKLDETWQIFQWNLNAGEITLMVANRQRCAVHADEAIAQPDQSSGRVRGLRLRRKRSGWRGKA